MSASQEQALRRPRRIVIRHRVGAADLDPESLVAASRRELITRRGEEVPRVT